MDGGRAMALPDTEYIVYVEKPSGPIEVRLEKHGYDVKWVDPATGECPEKQFKDKFERQCSSRQTATTTGFFTFRVKAGRKAC